VGKEESGRGAVTDMATDSGSASDADAPTDLQGAADGLLGDTGLAATVEGQGSAPVDGCACRSGARPTPGSLVWFGVVALFLLSARRRYA